VSAFPRAIIRKSGMRLLNTCMNVG